MGDPAKEVFIYYTNWRGVCGLRRIRPHGLVYENNEWHPDSQWLLEATDLDKGEDRTFALAQIQWWLPAAEMEKAKAFVQEKPSTSYLQRMMGIPYGRASSLIAVMEEIGIVSERKPDGTRTLRERPPSTTSPDQGSL